MTKNNSKEPTWKEIEETVKELGHAHQEYRQPASDGKHGYPWGKGYWEGVEFALDVIKPYFQEKMHEISVRELEVDCQWENCSGGRYCEKHSLEVVDN